MNRPILIIPLLIILNICNAQTSIPLHQPDIDLINFAIKDKRYGVKLVAEMTDYNLAEIRKYVDGDFFIKKIVDDNNNDISDTIKLSKQDKADIKRRLSDLRRFKWNSADAKGINLDNISIISLDSSQSNHLAYAIKYQIVPPIYFGNNNYCILSFSYSCGGLCGHGEVTIYKKAKNGWKRWNSLTSWDE